mgnify:CR=1 FL=1
MSAATARERRRLRTGVGVWAPPRGARDRPASSGRSALAAALGAALGVRRGGVAEAPMPFKVSDPFAARGWSDKVRDVRVEFNFTRYPPKAQRGKLPLGIRAFFAFMQRIRGMYEVVVDFAEEI